MLRSPGTQRARAPEEVGVIELSRRVTASRNFQNFILGIIVLTAVVAGIETSATLMASYGAFFDWLELVVQAVFVLEIVLRLLAYWPRLSAFFRDGWNVFDFVVVVTSLLPQSGAFAIVARLARLMRVTRLVSTFPELRLIVGTMLRSIPSMGHVIMLLGLLLYVYAILGFHLFHEHDPERWGTLGTALLTLFQMLTLEGWVEIQESALQAYPWAWIYFASFVLVAVFVVVNLFIAVVINSLETVKLEQQEDADRRSPHHALLRTIDEVRTRLEDLERHVRATPLLIAPSDDSITRTGR
jgi:voltage-gated sodium channel